jgi:hypothetical protein
MKKVSFNILIGALMVSVIFQSCEENENETKISSYDSTESHNMGKNCMECHKIGGSVEGWFTVAGTVYDDAKMSIFPNATISLTTGPNGTGNLVSSLEVDKKGNFYTTEPVDFGNGLYATVEGNSGINHMNVKVQSGQCNSCHGNSTDRIWTN